MFHILVYKLHVGSLPLTHRTRLWSQAQESGSGTRLRDQARGLGLGVSETRLGSQARESGSGTRLRNQARGSGLGIRLGD